MSPTRPHPVAHHDALAAQLAGPHRGDDLAGPGPSRRQAGVPAPVDRDHERRRPASVVPGPRAGARADDLPARAPDVVLVVLAPFGVRTPPRSARSPSLTIVPGTPGRSWRCTPRPPPRRPARPARPPPPRAPSGGRRRCGRPRRAAAAGRISSPSAVSVDVRAERAELTRPARPAGRSRARGCGRCRAAATGESASAASAASTGVSSPDVGQVGVQAVHRAPVPRTVSPSPSSVDLAAHPARAARAARRRLRAAARPARQGHLAAGDQRRRRGTARRRRGPARSSQSPAATGPGSTVQPSALVVVDPHAGGAQHRDGHPMCGARAPAVPSWRTSTPWSNARRRPAAARRRTGWTPTRR